MINEVRVSLYYVYTSNNNCYCLFLYSIPLLPNADALNIVWGPNKVHKWKALFVTMPHNTK